MSDSTPMFPGGPWWPMSEVEEANWRAVEAQDRNEGRRMNATKHDPLECGDCRHRPSQKLTVWGTVCDCGCHDAADAAPTMLAALKAGIATLADLAPPSDTHARRTIASMLAAVRLAEPVAVAATNSPTPKDERR